MRLFSKEYFTRKTMPRKRTKPPIQAKSFTPRNASQSIAGSGWLRRRAVGSGGGAARLRGLAALGVDAGATRRNNGQRWRNRAAHGAMEPQALALPAAAAVGAVDGGAGPIRDSSAATRFVSAATAAVQRPHANRLPDQQRDRQQHRQRQREEKHKTDDQRLPSMRRGAARATRAPRDNPCSQTGRRVDEFPRQREPLRQMRRERFHAERLRRVMTAEQQIHAEFLGRDRRPVRRFAGDERVDAFARGGVDLGAGAAGDNADARSSAPARAGTLSPRPPNECSSRAHEIIARDLTSALSVRSS